MKRTKHFALLNSEEMDQRVRGSDVRSDLLDWDVTVKARIATVLPICTVCMLSHLDSSGIHPDRNSYLCCHTKHLERSNGYEESDDVDRIEVKYSFDREDLIRLGLL